MNNEQKRLQDSQWKKWGPYLSERQWGTVREDYSEDGNAAVQVTHLPFLSRFLPPVRIDSSFQDSWITK